jgi:hypothetical protein
MVKFNTLLALFLSNSILTLANPAPIERMFITHCGACDGCGWQTSAIAWYFSNASEVEGYPPDAVGNIGHVATYEGNTLSVQLSNGDIFISKIYANATTLPAHSVAGSATSNAGKLSTVSPGKYCDHGYFPLIKMYFAPLLTRRKIGNWVCRRRFWPEGLAQVFLLSPGVNCYMIYECESSKYIFSLGLHHV